MQYGGEGVFLAAVVAAAALVIILFLHIVGSLSRSTADDFINIINDLIATPFICLSAITVSDNNIIMLN